MLIVDLINRDVASENETKKSMVTMRILYLLVFAAFIIDVLLAGVEVIDRFPYRIFGLLAVNIIFFILTYRIRTRMAFILFIGFILTWTISMIPCFGWSAGMQNYFIIILMLCFFTVYDRSLYKFILSGSVLVMRILLILLFGGTKSVASISSICDKLLQITNISTVFISIIIISYIFSREDNEAESKLMKYNDQLKKEANTDRLTGLYNRRRAEEYLQELKDTGYTGAISIAMGDIDFFKKVNDTYGHDAGDVVLKKVADMMLENCGDNSFISRWGGEEFLLIFKDVNGDDALVILEKLRRTIQKNTINAESSEINITMTFGLTEYNIKKDVEYAIKEADEKLYHGKSNGRNQVVY